MAILMVASSVRSNFPTVIPESIKKDHLVVMASEVSYNFLLFTHWNQHLIMSFDCSYFEKFPVSVKILRNSTAGHQIGMEGVSPLMRDWFSRRYKFE